MACANRAAERPCCAHGAENEFGCGDAKSETRSHEFDGLQGAIFRSLTKLHTPFLWKKMLAEAFGTFSLVFAGCGAIVINKDTNNSITHVGVAIVFGLVVMAMIYAVGHISGAHFNPAVTVAFTTVGRFPLKEAPGYIVSQIVAATAAASLLRLIMGNVANLGATIPSGSAGQSLGLEIVTTFFLMFVISAVATDSRAEGMMAGIAIGGTVLFDAMFAGPICGASMNPARSLGPAFASATFDDIWVYILGPLIGAVLGSVSYELIRCHSDVDFKSAHGCCK